MLVDSSRLGYYKRRKRVGETCKRAGVWLYPGRSKGLDGWDGHSIKAANGRSKARVCYVLRWRDNRDRDE